MTVSPSSADTGGIGFSLTGIQAADHVIRSGGCHSVPVTVTHNAPPQVDDISAEVEVWNGSKFVDTVYVTDDGPGRLTGSFYYCSFKGFGTFRLGPAEVDWSSCCDADAFLSGSFTSQVSTTFTAKQASSMSKPKWSKKKGVATVTAKGRWFSVEASRWRADPKGVRSTLQRRSGSSASWKTVKSARSDKKGVVRFRIKPKSRAQYRVVSAESKAAYSGISPVITRR
jgi:hypothetical protein